jgi:hypothetical protein
VIFLGGVPVDRISPHAHFLAKLENPLSGKGAHYMSNAKQKNRPPIIAVEAPPIIAVEAHPDVVKELEVLADLHRRRGEAHAAWHQAKAKLEHAGHWEKLAYDFAGMETELSAADAKETALRHQLAILDRLIAEKESQIKPVRRRAALTIWRTACAPRFVELQDRVHAAIIALDKELAARRALHAEMQAALGQFGVDLLPRVNMTPALEAFLRSALNVWDKNQASRDVWLKELEDTPAA